MDLWGDLWTKSTLKSLFLPGGVLMFAAFVLLQAGVVPLSASAVRFYLFAAFAAGILLAWRFHSSRILFALITLLLAQRALLFFSAGQPATASSGRIAVEAVAVLLPINFAVLSWRRERGFDVPTLGARLGFLFFQSVFIAVICRPGAKQAPVFLHPQLFGHYWQSPAIPQIAWVLFVAALIFLAFRFLRYRKPVESGFFWSLIAAFAALQSGAVTPIASVYIAASALILAGSIIENSYVLAYHDELTSLPGRRAFNEALLRLKFPYAIAAVDIDHFKAFNDNYGHETGDQVLRMVATRLSRVSGGGVAFRVGGEEFSILFPGERMKDVLPHLEALRLEVEAASFRVRGPLDRRHSIHPATDRRKPSRRKSSQPRSPRTPFGELSVTVSIGVAELTSRLRETSQVIQAADKALYRAKQSGRNRVETFASDRARAKRSIA